MTRRKNHKNEPVIQWLDVWKEIQETINRMEAPLTVRMAALDDNTEWWTKGDTMYLYIPDVVQLYIEQNMDTFKPILWPFLQSHHCTKLIYDI